ncbi:hypothetical protein PR048_027832 [Dryococelus australis]|uniref:Uncharacterized protein n=1 Tax=Dryococelus australis TaxID=614101 RepID=A0ABQ9GHL7_9NEOP|nr:hypothetical protein PR048_027832 [Dryococelus australis]
MVVARKRKLPLYGLFQLTWQKFDTSYKCGFNEDCGDPTFPEGYYSGFSLGKEMSKSCLRNWNRTYSLRGSDSSPLSLLPLESCSLRGSGSTSPLCLGLVPVGQRLTSTPVLLPSGKWLNNFPFCPNPSNLHQRPASLGVLHPSGASQFSAQRELRDEYGKIHEPASTKDPATPDCGPPEVCCPGVLAGRGKHHHLSPLWGRHPSSLPDLESVTRDCGDLYFLSKGCRENPPQVKTETPPPRCCFTPDCPRTGPITVPLPLGTHLQNTRDYPFQLVDSAGSLLKGEAARWWHTHEGLCDSWEEYQHSFLAHFSNQPLLALFTSQLYGKEEVEGEDIEIVLEKQKLFQQLYPEQNVRTTSKLEPATCRTRYPKGQISHFQRKGHPNADITQDITYTKTMQWHNGSRSGENWCKRLEQHRPKSLRRKGRRTERITIIHHNCAGMLPCIPMQLRYSQILVLVDSAATTRKTTLKCHSEEQNMEVECLMADDFREDLILGQGWLIQQQAVVDFEAKSIYFGTPDPLEIESGKLKERSLEEHGKSLQSLLWTYADVFMPNENLTRTSSACHETMFQRDQPIYIRPIVLSDYKQKVAEEQVAKMREADIIEPSRSPFNFKVVIVRMKDKTPRFRVNYQPINNRTQCSTIGSHHI